LLQIVTKCRIAVDLRITYPAFAIFASWLKHENRRAFTGVKLEYSWGRRFLGVGTSSQGTVFKITPAGVETLLYSFAGGFVAVADGGDPTTPLILGSDGNLYGTSGGGIGNNGTLVGTVFIF
jgi:uncharacterized repeat protein (TIGR03803 family)